MQNIAACCISEVACMVGIAALGQDWNGKLICCLGKFSRTYHLIHHGHTMHTIPPYIHDLQNSNKVTNPPAATRWHVY